MSLFNLFKSKPSGLAIEIKSPASFETTSLELNVTLVLASPTQLAVEKLAVRLRGDITSRKKFPGASPTQHLGEAIYSEGELVLAPAKPETVELKIPLDFSAIDSFEIPPENLSVASEEMKAAAAVNRTTNYNYFVEVTAKVKDGKELVQQKPIRLNQLDQVRTG